MARVIYGDASGNQLVVTTDKTQAYGLKGNDTLISGGNSSVLLIGGSGNDKLIMMGGIGTLNGGAGKDTFELTYSAVNGLSAVIEDYEAGDKIIVNFDGASAPKLSKRTLKSGDVVWKDSEGYFNLTLKSVRDNDYFDGDALEQVWKVLELTNAERESLETAPLTLSDGLTKAAQIRVNEMVGGDSTNISHTRPSGLSYATVFEEVGKTYSNHAENLTSGEKTAAVAMKSWMDSDDHRPHILDKDFTKLGVGYAHLDTAYTSDYWEQLFADSLQSPETVSLNNVPVATVHTVSTAVMLDDNDNDYSNTLNGATIAALDGNDSISNTGVFVSIAGGSGADTIDNIGANATICAGAGDDSIQLGGANNFIEFLAGDGSDIVYGFRADSTLSIAGDEYTPVTVGNDVIVAVGDDSITLKDAATLEGIDDYIDGKRKNHFKLTNGNNTKSYDIDGAIIEARGGNDNITNGGSYVSIDAGDGNDTVNNSGDFVTISAGNGNDSLVNNGGASVLFVYDSGNDTIQGFRADSTLRVSDGDYSSVAIGDDLILLGATDSIKVLDAANLSTVNIVDANGEALTLDDAKDVIGTEGNDTINNTFDDATIQALGGNDTITNSGSNVSIDAGDGNDSVDNQGSQVTIDTGAGEDTVSNRGSNVSIVSNDGNDSVDNQGSQVKIDTGAGDNTITNSGTNASIVSGEGNDSVDNQGSQVTINGGAGDNTITNSGTNASIVVGAGNDSVDNQGSRVTISTGDGEDTITNNGDTVAIHYGGGNDIVEGFNETSTLNLGSYAWQTVESDAGVLVYVTSNDETIGTITLKDYSSEEVNIKSTWKPSSGEGTVIANYTVNAFITGSDVDDTISNYADNVTIVAGNGNDSISNGDETNLGGSNVSIDAGNGFDTIYNDGDNVTIVGLAGYDSILNSGDSVTIDGGTGNDEIRNAIISMGGNNVLIDGGAGDDSIHNGDGGMGKNVTINGGSGNDFIKNAEPFVSIVGGNGDDTIDNSDYNDNHDVTIDGGAGNDSINNDSANVSIVGGEGDDTIANYGDSVTIDVSNGRNSIVNGNPYLEASVSGGNNVVITAGADDDFIRNNHGNNVSISSGDGDDLIFVAKASDFTVDMGAGSDTIWNDASNGLVNGGTGNDFIVNNGGLNAYDPSNNMTLNGDDGNDTLISHGSNSLLDGGAGDDVIDNDGNNSTILGGAGDDSISNDGSKVTIDGGNGVDFISNHGVNVKINGGDGDDTIQSYGGSYSLIDSGNGNDTIINGRLIDAGSDIYTDGDHSTVLGSAGNDFIKNCYGSSVIIDGGADNDSIVNDSTNVSIIGGTGNDSISLSADSKNNFIRYSLGDGNDTVWGITANDTLNFLADESLVSSLRSGDDIVYNVGTGSIRLVGAWGKPPKVTYGESGSSGGGSGGGGDNGGNSSGGNDNGNGNNGDGGKDNSSGGKSSDADKGDRDASGNQSASGSAGSSGASSGGSRGGGNNFRNIVSNPVSNNPVSNDIASNNINSYNYYYDNKLSVTPFSSPFDALRATTPAVNQYVYTGGNMVINTYQAGEKIFFLTDYTGSFSDGAGNLFFGSSTGALVVQNATDKFIDHYDAAGNPFLKAYTATTAGTIDGRWQAGFEVINGSAGADAIYAGDGGSQVWGGADNVADTLVGGAGDDIFIGGKAQGADIILNASSADVVNLNDATASDIVATLEADNVITVAFNTGNAIAVQSSEAQSATFQLADGSAYRFNHATKTWQSANQHAYNGGNQIINDYQTGEKILFNATYTGATFDDAGNLIVGSSTGALAVTNATDKVIDLRDATGNDFVKAYAATTAGVIDGRGLAGFEVINGSQDSDAIFAGDGGSQLWGGADNAADTLIGGNGSDIFIGGKVQGADVMLNASSADVVHLNDATLSDIIGTAEDNGAIAVAFNTGNVIAVQSSEVQSAAFQLADGSAYRYNHASKSWQSA